VGCNSGEYFSFSILFEAKGNTHFIAKCRNLSVDGKLKTNKMRLFLIAGYEYGFTTWVMKACSSLTLGVLDTEGFHEFTGKLNKSVEKKTIKRYKMHRNHVQLRKSQRLKLL